jgi:hypothetical protein
VSNAVRAAVAHAQAARATLAEQAVQEALQLEVWEDEGAPAAPAED